MRRIGAQALFGSFAVFALGLLLFMAAPQVSSAQALENKRAELEAQLAAIEADISAKREVLQEKQTERTSLERDIAILNAQIEKAQLSIKHRDLTLRQIQGDINDKVSAITVLDEKMARSKQSLVQLIRRTNQIDDTTLVELALSGSLSEIFTDVDQFLLLQRELDASFAEITTIQEDLSERKKTSKRKRVKSYA